MRRLVGAAIVAALAVAIFSAARPTGDAHAATTCTKHTKRIVRHVKRHGKHKRIVRLHHYWTCEEVAAPVPVPVPAAPATPAPVPAPTEPPASQPEPEANAIGVAADDHGGKKSYTLSRSAVRPGKLTVQLNNKGEDPHDMEMQQVDEAGEPIGEPIEIPKVGPGEQMTETFEVQPGRYRMWCNLFHHAEEGMEATIEVK